jgi:phosphate transport system substrate-binding protein
MVDGALVDNPTHSWADFNADLPDAEIAAFIPGTKHGTREVFEEKVMLQGCEDTGAMEAMMEMRHVRRRRRRRLPRGPQDGKSVDIDGDYTETLARIDANPTASACSAWRSTRTTPTS